MPQANSNSVRASIEATGKVPKPGYSGGTSHSRSVPPAMLIWYVFRTREQAKTLIERLRKPFVLVKEVKASNCVSDGW